MRAIRHTVDIRAAILDLLSDLTLERDAMPHRARRLGQPDPVDPTGGRYAAVSRAIDHLLEASNELSHAIAAERRA